MFFPRPSAPLSTVLSIGISWLSPILQYEWGSRFNLSLS